MKGKLGRYLGLDEHLALGVTIAWYPGFTHHVTWAALWDFMEGFRERGVAAWDEFVASRAGRPYPIPETPDEGEGAVKQHWLENAICRPRRWPNTGGHDGARRLPDLRFRHACRPRCGDPVAVSQRRRKGPARRLEAFRATYGPSAM